MWKIKYKLQHNICNEEKSNAKEIIAENFPEFKTRVVRVKKPTVY